MAQRGAMLLFAIPAKCRLKIKDEKSPPEADQPLAEKFKFMMHNNKRGFTLLETLIAISILVTAIVGPLTLAAQTIRAQQVAKDNLIAANLAQEGIELVRNYRSNNILQWRIARAAADDPLSIHPLDHWVDGMDDCFNASGCGIDADVLISAAVLPSCSALDDCALGFDTASLLYTHCTPGVGDCVATPFNRAVRIENIVSNQEVRVRVTVSWSGILGSRSLEATSHLLNWDDEIF